MKIVYRFVSFNVDWNYFCNTALSKNDPAAPIKRPRRNSESVVHVKSEDNDQTLFYENLRLQEAKFYQEKIHRLEEEIKRLKRQIEEARSIAGSELTSPPKRPIKCKKPAYLFLSIIEKRLEYTQFFVRMSNFWAKALHSCIFGFCDSNMKTKLCGMPVAHHELFTKS